MPSKLLRDLDVIINSTSDRVVWARSMCRQASHFARRGETEEAVHSINVVRSKYGNSLEPEVAAWLMLTEGILSYYSGAADLGIGRLQRAHAVAAATANCAARPTCAAWLALYCLNTRRFDEMVVRLQESLQLAAKDDHQARARASLVLADAFHLGGRFDLARPWYDLARLHATKEGDESTISAMLHNVAAFRACNVKLADALGTRLHDEARRATMEATSAAAYDHAVGTRSFAQFVPHVTAQLLVVEKKYEEAWASLSRIDVSGLPNRAHAVHYVDLATCALHLGNQSLLDQMVPLAVKALDAATDADDVVYVCCRLSSIFSAMDNQELADQFQSRASSEIRAYRSAQADLIAKLVALNDMLVPADNKT